MGGLKNSNFGGASRRRWFWVTLYVLYVVFILLSATAFYAEQSITSRANDYYEYSLTFNKDGTQTEHYIVTRTTRDQPGKIHVTFNKNQNNLYVETTNIQQLSIDCRSIAKEKTWEILGKNYEDNKNYYKTYFIEEVKEFTVIVNADHKIALTLRDIPYPSRVTLNGRTLVEGERYDYIYRMGEIDTEVPIGNSDVKIYFQDTSDDLVAYFETDKNGFYHLTDTKIEFDASGSTGNIIDYIWDFGDGRFGNGMTPLHSYDEEGDYEVILVVRDGNGLIARKTNALYIHDIDGDNLPDDWEKRFFGDLSLGKTGDYDRDKLENGDEYIYNTDPTNRDSDNDGFTDKEEIDKNTDPTDRFSKPEKEEEDKSMFGLGKVAGIDLFLISILIIIIIIIMIAALMLSRKRPKIEEEEEEEITEEVAEEEEGAEEEETYECPECGSPVLEDQPECDECGATLEWEEEPEEDEEIKERFIEKPVIEAEPEIPKESEVVKEEIIEEFECPTCGATVSEDDIVCPTCGEEFE